MNIFVGSLNYDTTEDNLRDLFSEFGNITSVKVIKDFNGRSRGFAFVEMEDKDAAIEAIKNLQGKSFMDHTIEVNEARPKPTGGGNRGGGGGYSNKGGYSDRKDSRKRY